MKDLILNEVGFIVSKFLYYDRKDCEDLEVGAIDNAIENDIITVDEIVAKFKSCLEDGLQE